MTNPPTGANVRLRVLGPVSVEFAGPEGEGVRLTQPRLLGLLAYLLLARPRGLQSRDKVIAMFWPDADAAAGRQGLRNSLHRLRSALGSGAVLTAGDHLVGIYQSRVSCDALEMEAAAASDHARAIELWAGELLDGFHVSNAPEFERWLDGERLRMHALAFASAWCHATDALARGDHHDAAAAAHFAMALSPTDESSLRRLVELLEATGDRSGALQAYDRFVRALREDLDVEPSDTTLAIAAALRRPRAPATVLEASPASVAALRPDAAPIAGAMLPVRVAHLPRMAVGVIAGLTLFGAAAFVLGNRIAFPDDTPASPSIARLTRRDAALPRRYRTDTAAFRQYLRGTADLDEGKVASARRRFQALVNDAPLYAPGWAGHSVALYRSGFTDIPPREAMRAARLAAERALAMDSSLADALETMAAVDLFGNWNLAASRRRIDAARRLYPNDADLVNLLGVWYRWSGDQTAALRLKQRAHELDPLSRRYAIQVAWSYYLGHRCAEAAREYRRLPPEVRAVARADIGLYRSLRCTGEFDQAAALLRESALASGDSATARLLGGLLTPPQNARAVDEVFRRRLAGALSVRQAAWTPPEGVARLYAEREMADSAILWLDSMYVDRSMMLYTVPFDPLYDFLRDDPRFVQFVRKLPWLTAANSK